jgi:hypothetical protein
MLAEIMGTVAEGHDMEPRAVERFPETMAEEVEERAQMLSSYALDRTTGFYVKVRNVEGILRMLVFQGPERAGERPNFVADLLFTREQFQEMARIMGMPGLWRSAYEGIRLAFSVRCRGCHRCPMGG